MCGSEWRTAGTLITKARRLLVQLSAESAFRVPRLELAVVSQQHSRLPASPGYKPLMLNSYSLDPEPRREAGLRRAACEIFFAAFNNIRPAR